MKCEWGCGREATKTMFVELKRSTFTSNAGSRQSVKRSRTAAVCATCYATIQRTPREKKPLTNAPIEGQLDVFDVLKAIEKEGR
jgi:hypothetical protein